MRPSPNVFTIPPGVPFLPTLADAILGGAFGLLPGDDPLSLAAITILLPTRRAARSLRQILTQRSGSGAAILPRIRPIGDVDEEDHLLQPPSENPADALVLPPAISRLGRLLILTELVQAWGRTVKRTTLAIGPDEPLLIPASAADAVRLASDLARLIDDMATAGVPWRALETLTPDDYPRYWQITLDFLAIAAEAWPAILAERGEADPAARRDQLLRAEAARLVSQPPPGPIIAAGSTGSIPATAALLAAIARLPQGAVVLPGLDQHLPADAWAAIADPGKPTAGTPSHPQFGLAHLLAAIGIDRRDVATLGHPPPPAMAARARLLSEALRPAETTEAWANVPPPDPAAFAGIELMTARNEQEEALAIAIALRGSVEQPGHQAALVTPDRALARRVAVELGRWGIIVDDSAGQPLDGTLPGVFARLLAEATLTPSPVALLALLKHPLARFGMKRARCRAAARTLELALFRGATAVAEIAGLPAAIAETRLANDMRAVRMPPRAWRRLSHKDWDRAEELARKLVAIAGPLARLAAQREIRAAETTRLLAVTIETAANDDAGELADLGEAGDSLATLLAGLAATDAVAMTPAEYPAFLKAAMSGVAVTPTAGVDPRIHIWGTLEARLQTVDLLILAGLDEGVWPGEMRTDPWLSRRMRQAIGLPPPERRIGLAAHDFAEALGTPRVVLTRADKRGGAPTVASRWLQRLEAVLGPAAMATIAARGAPTIRLARQLDRVPPDEVRPAARPAPRPRIDARPRELSITTIETLIRDPYAVYARRILKLEPLDAVGQPADARTRGTLIHEALADFTRTWHGPFDETAERAFLALWHQHFEAIGDYPEVHALWSLRAPRIAAWIVAFEAARDGVVLTRYPEIAGEYDFSIPRGRFKLTGRADRIDLLRNDRVAIYDYKTGMPPSAKQVVHFMPQLGLEAAIARAGAFGPAFAGRSVAELAWIGLAQIGKDDPLRSAVTDEFTPDTLGDEVLTRLHRLIAAYDHPDKAYVSQARPMFERRLPGDYDHLARVAEWRLAGEAEPS